jgi:hypothetical protein
MMKPGDLVRLNREFAEANNFDESELSLDSIGVIVGINLEGELSVLIEGRMINMFEYELEAIDES